MAKAKQGDKVRTHYQGMLDDGTVFDSSEGRDPLEFTIGSGEVIPGFEQGVIGMDPGESKEIKIPVDEAYGPRRDDMIVPVGRHEFPPDMDPKPGERLEMKRPDGVHVLVTVVETSEDTVTIDANHPLAGHDLTFQVQLVDVV